MRDLTAEKTEEDLRLGQECKELSLSVVRGEISGVYAQPEDHKE